VPQKIRVRRGGSSQWGVEKGRGVHQKEKYGLQTVPLVNLTRHRGMKNKCGEGVRGDTVKDRRKIASEKGLRWESKSEAGKKSSTMKGGTSLQTWVSQGKMGKRKRVKGWKGGG